MGITLAFIYIPLLVIAIYAFNKGITLKWPPESLSTKWFGEAIDNQGARDALVNSLKVGAIATVIALVLGTLASLGVARHRFFGRETVSFLVVIPIALPGIVTGLALSNTFTQVFGVSTVAVHGGRRPRNLLHRGRLQQRDRAAAADVDFARGGVG